MEMKANIKILKKSRATKSPYQQRDRGFMLLEVNVVVDDKDV